MGRDRLEMIFIVLLTIAAAALIGLTVWSSVR